MAVGIRRTMAFFNGYFHMIYHYSLKVTKPVRDKQMYVAMPYSDDGVLLYDDDVA